jgi:hypothetical protein
MNEEKNFFKTCFNIVAGLEVKNESQAIAKEVVLSEIENLQQQCKKQKEAIDRILNETKETRNILDNNRDDNILSKSCLLSYLEIVEDLLKEVSK